ncbi:MAG: BREX system Lon protease-like protein BrxL [Promethearchaeota archaeon]
MRGEQGNRGSILGSSRKKLSKVRTSLLGSPSTPKSNDLPFLDRFHIYLPGWELPRFTPEMFTKHFGFIVDIMAEYFQFLRSKSFYTELEKHVSWGAHLDQRDQVRVKAVASGLLKLTFPDGSFTPEDLVECVKYAMEFRRRVKEQLRKMGSVEFRRTNFSLIRNRSSTTRSSAASSTRGRGTSSTSTYHTTP